MSESRVKLGRTHKEITRINADLRTKCGPSYNLVLSQYGNRGTDSAVYDDKEYDIILCLYHGDRCVSSVTGKYDESTGAMELLSKTVPEYEGLKFNLYLRAAFMYLMCFVRPRITTIFSYSLNPISTYAMYKHFGATNSDLKQYAKKRKLTPETFTLVNANDFHAYYINKYKQTPEKAQEELDGMLEDSSLEELGFETEDEAIQFIMETMNGAAISLELDLAKRGMKEFLLDKLLSTQTKCDERSTPTINRATRNTQKTSAGGKTKRRIFGQLTKK